ADADGRRRRHLALAEPDRRLEDPQHPVAGKQRVVAIAQARQQHRELAAVDLVELVAGTQHLADQFADRGRHAFAGGKPVGNPELAQALQPHQHHAERAIVRAALRQQLTQSSEQVFPRHRNSSAGSSPCAPTGSGRVMLTCWEIGMPSVCRIRSSGLNSSRRHLSASVSSITRGRRRRLGFWVITTATSPVLSSTSEPVGYTPRQPVNCSTSSPWYSRSRSRYSSCSAWCRASGAACGRTLVIASKLSMIAAIRPDNGIWWPTSRRA